MINGNGCNSNDLATVRLQLDKLVSDGLKLDADRDGVVTAAEIEQEATKQADQASRDWLGTILPQLVPMTLTGMGMVEIAPGPEAALSGASERPGNDLDIVGATERIVALWLTPKASTDAGTSGGGKPLLEFRV